MELEDEPSIQETGMELEDEPSIQETVQILREYLNIGEKHVHAHRERPIICMVPRVFKDDNTSSSFMPRVLRDDNTSSSFKPRVLRDDSTSFFKPRVVSIGPLHREDAELQNFEGVKKSFMYKLLTALSSNPVEMLISFVKGVKPTVARIRGCYAEMENMTDIELMAMMVTDSCFILQFLDFATLLTSEDDIITSEDVIEYHSICLDLLQLENQIPFFVLQIINDCTISSSKHSALLRTILLEKLWCFTPFDDSVWSININVDETPDHILGLLHQSIKLPSYDSQVSSQYGLFYLGTVYSATDLQKSGVRFKRIYDRDRPMTIEFVSSWLTRLCWPWCKNTLRMPPIRIGDESDGVLKNFIAYEQLGQAGHTCISSYIYAIRMLVYSKKDFQVLVDSRIIESLESYQYTLDLLESLSNGIILKDFHYKDPWRKMLSYSNSNLGSIRRTYFSGAWSYIASISGLILFILTAIQTYSSIRAL